MAPLKSKENVPSRRRSSRRAAMLSLSPVMKPAEELLQAKHTSSHEVELRQIGVHSLSYQTAVELVDNKESSFTICGWPKGKKTNENYATLLSLKDQYDVFFYLCKTSPEMCVTDALKFLFLCLDHFLRCTISKEILEGKASQMDFLGAQPMPFQHAWQVQYIAYLRWVDQMGVISPDKCNHEVVLYRAETSLGQYLARKGYEFSPEQLPFSPWIRREARAYDEVDRPERNVMAHLFTDLLQLEKAEGFTTTPADLPPPCSVISDDYELGKKVFVLEHLKSKQPKMGRDGNAQKAAYFLIETFMAEKVERCREVLYGDSRAMIPGKLPPNQRALKL